MLLPTRPTLLCSLLLAAICAPIAAQEPAGEKPAQPEPTAAQAQEPAAQEPATKPLPPKEDPAARVANLKRRLQKVDEEILFIEQIAADGGLLTRVAPFLHDRKVGGQVIKLSADAIPESPTERIQNPSIPMPGMEQVEIKRPEGRLLGDAEKERLGADVIFTVDAEPVTQAEFDQLFDYFQSYPRNESDEDLRRMTVESLILLKGTAAQFADNAAAARERIEDAQARLAAGEDFAEVAKADSQCPSGAQGGSLGAIAHGAMVPMFEMAVFSMKVGETSGIVQSAFGYHIIKVTDRVDGEDPSTDRVTASHILALYADDADAVRTAMDKVRRGGVELAFVDNDWRQLAPRFN